MTFRVMSFDATAEEKWDWSVSNQSNNSGWETVTGLASWAVETHSRAAKPRINVTWVNGQLLASITGGIPVSAAYDIFWVQSTKQHPPVRCDDKGSLPHAAVAVGVEQAQPTQLHPKLSSKAITVLWPDLADNGTGQKCSPHGASLPDSWFKKVEMISDLTKKREVTLHANGTIPIPLKSSEDCYGCEKFKGTLTYTWHATMTLQREG